jgi:ParB family chromosome partitioning protein
LLGTPDRSLQESLARHAVAEHWSVRTLEEAVRIGGMPEATVVPAGERPEIPREPIDGAGLAPATRLRPPGLLELEGLLADYLSTRVKVAMGSKRGKLTVDFADLEDLERLYYLITGPDPDQPTT